MHDLSEDLYSMDLKSLVMVFLYGFKYRNRELEIFKDLLPDALYREENQKVLNKYLVNKAPEAIENFLQTIKYMESRGMVVELAGADRHSLPHNLRHAEILIKAQSTLPTMFSEDPFDICSHTIIQLSMLSNGQFYAQIATFERATWVKIEKRGEYRTIYRAIFEGAGCH